MISWLKENEKDQNVFAVSKCILIMLLRNKPTHDIQLPLNFCFRNPNYAFTTCPCALELFFRLPQTPSLPKVSHISFSIPSILQLKIDYNQAHLDCVYSKILKILPFKVKITLKQSDEIESNLFSAYRTQCTK